MKKKTLDDSWSISNCISLAVLLVAIAGLFFQWIQIRALSHDVQSQQIKIENLESKTILVGKLLAKEGNFGHIVSDGSIEANGSGNVGIGTKTPLEKLDLRGRIRVSDVITGNNSGNQLCSDQNNTFCLCGKCAK